MFQWGVFPCGHALCVECTSALIQSKSSHYFGPPRISCPLCRETCVSTDINYVNLGVEPDSQDGMEVEPVSGNHASKIVAVVQTLLRIRRQDPRAKALVFSSVSKES